MSPLSLGGPWELFAIRDGERLEHFYPHPRTCRACSAEGEIVKVRVTIDPAGSHFGWHEYNDGSVSMIYPNRHGTEMCFPYGSKAEEDRGRGKLVQVRVEVIPMSRTIVSWTRFCEWVQGKRAVSETDDEEYGHSTGTTTIRFADGSKAIFKSEFDLSFGEKEVEPPIVEIEEAP